VFSLVLYAPSPIAEVIRAAQKPVTYDNHDLTWWHENSYYTYPALLLNYYHQKKPFHFRQSMKVPDWVTVIGDSGGYEILSRRAKGLKVNIDPLQCLRWQEENCDIGITLDLSPVNLQPIEGGKSVATNPNPISHEEFERRLNQTCKNNDIFDDNRDSTKKLKIYNVVHSGMGKTNCIEIWYERVMPIKFEGWSIAPKPPGNPRGFRLGHAGSCTQ